MIVLTYDSTADTVSAYGLARSDVPFTLWSTIEDLEAIYQRAVPQP